MRRASPAGSSRSSHHDTRTTTRPSDSRYMVLRASRARRAAVPCQRRLSVSTTTPASRNRKSAVQTPNSTCVSGRGTPHCRQKRRKRSSKSDSIAPGSTASASRACSALAPRRPGRASNASATTSGCRRCSTCAWSNAVARSRGRSAPARSMIVRTSDVHGTPRRTVTSSTPSGHACTTIPARRCPSRARVTWTGPGRAGRIPQSSPAERWLSTPSVAIVAASQVASRSSRGWPIT